jgi:hypothetical protein
VIRAPEFASVSCYLSIAVYRPRNWLLYPLKLLQTARPDRYLERRFTDRLSHFHFLQGNPKLVYIRIQAPARCHPTLRSPSFTHTVTENQSRWGRD